MIRMLEYEVPQLTYYPIIMGSTTIKSTQQLLTTIINVTEASNIALQHHHLISF